MKIECTCGAKHEFAVTEEMSKRPVRFVCPSCGLEASDFVDGLVRGELGQTAAPMGEAVLVEVARTTRPVPVQEVAPKRPPLAGNISTVPTLLPAGSADVQPGGTRCAKHLAEVCHEKCRICSRPICRKCMELFGFVCSPLCKAKAEARGFHLPVYAGQKSVREARQWRHVVWTASAALILLVGFGGFWLWYSWFGSVPKPVFSVRFNEPVYSGQCYLAGKDKDQVVFLHGSTLARYNMRTKQQVWSVSLLDKGSIQRAIERQNRANQELINRANNEGAEELPKFPSAENLSQQMERQQAASLTLLVRGQNIWVASPERLSHYEWDSGKPSKELPANTAGGLILRGDEVFLVEDRGDKAVVTAVNLVTEQSRTETLAEAGQGLAALGSNTSPSALQASGPVVTGAGLPGRVPGTDRGKALDPQKVAGQVQSLPLAAKLALPATLAATLNQERALAAMDDRQSRPESLAPASEASLSVVADKSGFIEFRVQLLEQRIASRSAMKPAAGKDVLEGNVTAGKSTELAGEFLNEMQRSRGGDMVREDVSRYQVTVLHPGGRDAWKSEMVGPPRLFPLETVTVVAANNAVVVLDKSNKKLWDSKLAYNVRDLQALDERAAPYGRGPCVEHKGALYIIDDGVLTAFDLRTGNVRWRLPSVGVAGLFFDDHDMLIVNSTTASPESIKYSRQIDLSQKVISIVLKIDSKNGRALWKAEPGGMASHVSSKGIFVVQSFQPEEQEEDNPYRVETGLEQKPFLHIRLLNPRNGRELWDHVQERAPLNINFDQNTIGLVFKKEVQVLRFLAW